MSIYITVEANGWELILHFVSLGLGWAIVNSCCRIPTGFIAIPVPELSSIDYYILERKARWKRDSVESLKQNLIQYGDSWKVESGNGKKVG